MARSFTVDQLLTRAKERADLENSSFIDDPEWKGCLSTAYAQLYSVLADTGLRYFESVQSVAHSSFTDNGDGGGRVALPADHWSTIDVMREDSASGPRTPLGEVMAQERHIFAGASGNEGQAFCLSGAFLVVYPKPTGGTYIHTYVPQPADLSAASGATSVDVVTPDGEDYIIWSMAMFALAKEESDTSVCERYRAAARENLEHWATRRLLQSRRRMIVDEGPWYLDPADWRK